MARSKSKHQRIQMKIHQRWKKRKKARKLVAASGIKARK